MSVTTKGAEDMPYLDGACTFSVVAQNNSGVECSFYIDITTATANSTNITPMGGSIALVKPGNNVALVYTVPYKQFGVSSFADVHSFEFDIVQYEGSSMMNPDGSSTEIDRVHVAMQV